MRLPPLNAIVVFEAAGRHESLVKAAEELGVTPGAVSRQIKRLEQTVGIALFIRSNRKITLSDDGRAYWTAINSIASRLRYETEQLMRRTQPSELRVSCSISFMQYWMLPRFLSFQQAVPDLNVTFAITRSAQAFEPELDCGIRIRREPWSEFACERLLPAPMVAICSPDYAAAHPPIDSIDSLRDHTLVYSTAHDEHWSLWLGARAGHVLETARKIRMDGSGVAYQAILSGVGVGIGRACLVGDDILSGRLLMLLPNNVAQGDSLYLVTRPANAQKPQYRLFREWIRSEVTDYWGRLQKSLPGVLPAI